MRQICNDQMELGLAFRLGGSNTRMATHAAPPTADVTVLPTPAAPLVAVEKAPAAPLVAVEKAPAAPEVAVSKTPPPNEVTVDATPPAPDVTNLKERAGPVAISTRYVTGKSLGNRPQQPTRTRRRLRLHS